MRARVDCKIRYVDNHTTLVEEMLALSKQSPKPFVFNLCDEGFRNDAENELHVTALLDMLNLPYSGAAPQSLTVRVFCFF